MTGIRQLLLDLLDRAVDFAVSFKPGGHGQSFPRNSVGSALRLYASAKRARPQREAARPTCYPPRARMVVTIVSRVVSRLVAITEGNAATTSDTVASEAMILAGSPMEKTLA